MRGTIRIAVLCGMGLLASQGAMAQDVRYVDAGRGPVAVYLPSTYDENVPMPLIVSLHGYSGNSQWHDLYFGFRPHLDTYEFLLALPDGTTDLFGNQFWNATDACCDFGPTNVDDSGYLRTLIEMIADTCAIDPNRISLVGHSNGGFMSYRMACDHPDLIASIASLAGATHADPDDCAVASPVHTLQIHGTNDTVIRYNGGFINGNRYPGAVETAEMWASNNGCWLIPDDSSPPMDLDRSIGGAETTVLKWEDDCSPGGSAELWTIVGGSHGPNFSAAFAPSVIEWLLGHPKPCPADFNGDGAADTRDVLEFLNAWSASDAGADCNGDGVINTLDVLCFLSVWTEGC